MIILQLCEISKLIYFFVSNLQNHEFSEFLKQILCCSSEMINFDRISPESKCCTLISVLSNTCLKYIH